MRPAAAGCLVGVILAAASARIASTYPVFSQAWDEPAHVHCGLRWWEYGLADCDPMHPPLARVVMAAPLYFKGLRTAAMENMYAAGTAELHSDGEYWTNLALARSATLIFFWFAGVCVYGLGAKAFGREVGVLAVLLYAVLPPVLNWASVAYTDTAMAATFAFFVHRWFKWLGAHSLRNAVWMGVAAGLAVGAKYSSIPYMVVLIAATAVLLRREALRRMLGNRRLLGAAGGAMAITLWAIFHFAVVPISPLHGTHPFVDRFLARDSIWSALAYRILETPLPLAGMVPGLADLLAFRQHFNSGAEPFYFMGAVHTQGVWYYFPVMLLCELPLPFLAALAGAPLLWFSGVWQKENRLERGLLLAAPAGVLAVNMVSLLTFAPRHLSGCYPFLAVAAAAVLAALWRSGRWRWVGRSAAAAAVALTVGTSILAHPDHHAYRGALSALLHQAPPGDAGRDVGRLAKVLRELDASEVSVALEGTNDLSRMGLPEHERLEPYTFTPGWIAISERKLRIHDNHSPPYDGFAWLRQFEPVTRAGPSIRIYYIPETEARAVTRPGGAVREP